MEQELTSKQEEIMLENGRERNWEKQMEKDGYPDGFV